jgi:hypothetical protein
VSVMPPILVKSETLLSSKMIVYEVDTSVIIVATTKMMLRVTNHSEILLM